MWQQHILRYWFFLPCFRAKRKAPFSSLKKKPVSFKLTSKRDLTKWFYWQIKTQSPRHQVFTAKISYHTLQPMWDLLIILHVSMASSWYPMRLRGMDIPCRTRFSHTRLGSDLDNICYICKNLLPPWILSTLSQGLLSFGICF